MGGLARPRGAVNIEKTKMVSPDILAAKLSGASGDRSIAVVRRGPDNYHVVAPKDLGGTRKVSADSLTDGLHQAVFEMSEAADEKSAADKKEKKGKKS